LPTFQNKLKGSFAVKWIKDKGGLNGKHSPETFFRQPHYNGEGLLRYDSIGTFAAANSWALGQECQISHSKEVIKNKCVYLACECQGRYDIQAAKNRLGPVRDPVSITSTANRYLFVRGLNSCKHLVLRKWLLAVLLGAIAYVPRQKSILDVICRL
jgi:hypothetical protein